MQNAWLKYGEQAFAFRHIATVADRATRCAEEVRIIASLRSKGRAVYNASTGGEGQPHTAESRAKLSAAHMGKVVSPETRKRMSASLKGIPTHQNARAASSKYWKGRKRGPMSEETKRKVSIAKTGTPSHPWTKESRSKLSESLKGRTLTEQARINMRAGRKRALARGQRSRIKLITHCGITMCLQDWAALIGIERRTLGYRLGRGGLSVVDAMTLPVK